MNLSLPRVWTYSDGMNNSQSAFEKVFGSPVAISTASTFSKIKSLAFCTVSADILNGTRSHLSRDQRFSASCHRARCTMPPIVPCFARTATHQTIVCCIPHARTPRHIIAGMYHRAVIIAYMSNRLLPAPKVTKVDLHLSGYRRYAEVHQRRKLHEPVTFGIDTKGVVTQQTVITISFI